MDPNLFALDIQRAGEIVLTIALLSIFVERALALLLESRWYLDRFDGKSVKELIAFIVSAAVAWTFQFDAFAILMVAPENTWIGYLLTGGAIAGGSKGSVKLIRDFLNVKSRGLREKEAEKEEEKSGAGGKKAPAKKKASKTQGDDDA